MGEASARVSARGGLGLSSAAETLGAGCGGALAAGKGLEALRIPCCGSLSLLSLIEPTTLDTDGDEACVFSLLTRFKACWGTEGGDGDEASTRSWGWDLLRERLLLRIEFRKLPRGELGSRSLA